MIRVSFFIDGFNLYHALEGKIIYHKYKWLDLTKLSQSFLTTKEELENVYFFTAYTPWNQNKKKRHNTYVRALQFTNVEVIFGAFRLKDKRCRSCGQFYKTYEEKQSDVNLAIKLFETAMADEWDVAFIVSADSDLIPAVKCVLKNFSEKRIGIVIPIGRRAEELKKIVDFHRKIKQKHLRTCQFDDPLQINGDRILNKPSSWS